MDQIDEQGLPIWPAAERNKQPIADELSKVLPKTGGLLLEVASGTGQHASHFAQIFPHFQVQSSDFDPDHLATLTKRHQVERIQNFRPPLPLDVRMAPWPIEDVDVIYNANMVHIAPWEVTEALFQGAAQALRQGGLLITYGPYLRKGVPTAESNLRFDASLRDRNDEWGVRSLDEMMELGASANLIARAPLTMPANNFLVVWDRR